MTDMEKAARAVLDTRVDFGGDKHPITDGALVARTALDALRAALDSEQGDGWVSVDERIDAAVRAERERADEAQACLRLMVDEMGIGPWMHEQPRDDEDPCPEDDSCACPKVQRINAACRARGEGDG